LDKNARVVNGWRPAHSVTMAGRVSKGGISGWKREKLFIELRKWARRKFIESVSVLSYLASTLMQRATSTRSQAKLCSCLALLPLNQFQTLQFDCGLAARGEEEPLVLSVDVMALDNKLRSCRMIVRLYV
jgi:hypothetical protein